MASKTPFYIDETLSDLAHVTVTVNRTRVEADVDKPMIATMTCDASTLNSILTAASLHMSESPFVPKPEVGENADTIRLNNLENQAWHWQMRDTINYATGALSKACSPDYGDDKHSSIKLDRNLRKMRIDQTKTGTKRHAFPEADEGAGTLTAEQVKDQWEALEVAPLAPGKFVGLMVAMLDNPDAPVDREIVMQLLESYRRAEGKVQKLEKNMGEARRLLGGY